MGYSPGFSRGLDGWFYIGKRVGGGFYTLEEIDIARAAIERWMDNQSAAEIARRLVNLQQQRQIETRLLDQKAHRILHDDVLPLLHTALLAEPQGKAASAISEAHQQISRLLRDAPPLPPVEIARNGLFAALETIARNEANLLKARLTYEVDDRAMQSAAALPPDAAETIFYASRECLRNIQKHTRPSVDEGLKIRIRAVVDGMLQISIENNGTGKETGGDYPTPPGGQGIRLHNAMLAVFGGGMRLEYLENGDTRVTISLPVDS